MLDHLSIMVGLQAAGWQYHSGIESLDHAGRHIQIMLVEAAIRFKHI